jgi:hypothetical protein
MSLVHTIRSASHIRDEFHRMGRGDQFTYDALGRLYDYLWDLGEDIGEPIEFDVIAICCEWCEYDDIHELAEYYDVAVEDVIDDDEDADDDDIELALEEEMHTRGTLLSIKSGGYLFSE